MSSDRRRIRAAAGSKGAAAVSRHRSRVTLADIGRACGVSPATVSLALRNNPLVSAHTRARVAAEIERQGYVYNRGAADLRRQTSSTVAMIVNDLSNPFFAEFVAGADETLAAAGYITLLGSTAESLERQDAVIRSLMERHPAGIILSPAEKTDGKSLAPLLGERAPVLVFNREVPGGSWDFLVCDNRRGARLATEHLLAFGHRRIAFLGGHATSSSCRERRLGYCDALRAAGVEPRPGWMIECAPTRREAAAAGAQLPCTAPDVTAAVCYNDIVALGLMYALGARGREVGHSFAVTGFDDIPEAALFVPTLTTIAVQPRVLGRRAARLMLGRLGRSPRAAKRIVAPVRLVPRASSCPPPNP